MAFTVEANIKKVNVIAWVANKDCFAFENVGLEGYIEVVVDIKEAAGSNLIGLKHSLIHCRGSFGLKPQYSCYSFLVKHLRLPHLLLSSPLPLERKDSLLVAPPHFSNT